MALKRPTKPENETHPALGDEPDFGPATFARGMKAVREALNAVAASPKPKPALPQKGPSAKPARARKS